MTIDNESQAGERDEILRRLYAGELSPQQAELELAGSESTKSPGAIRQARYRAKTEVLRGAVLELRQAYADAVDSAGMTRLADGLDDLDPTEFILALTKRIKGKRLGVFAPTPDSITVTVGELETLGIKSRRAAKRELWRLAFQSESEWGAIEEIVNK